jgi:type IV pilus modification protein PilV
MSGNDMRKYDIEVDSRGFTLIEVMFALAIFAIGILGLYALQLSSIKGNSSAGKRTQAVAWAANRMEILQETPFADIANGQETRGIYNIQWTAPQVDLNNDGDADARDIQINVTWKGLGGSKSTRLNFIKIQD